MQILTFMAGTGNNGMRGIMSGLEVEDPLFIPNLEIQYLCYENLRSVEAIRVMAPTGLMI